MANKETFYQLCEIMAELEDTITSLEKIGLVVEPGTKGTVSDNLYRAASTAYRIASTLLEFPDVNTENDVCNELLSTGLDTMEEVSRRIWNEYGIKSNIQ